MTYKTSPFAAYAFDALVARLYGRKQIPFSKFQELLPDYSSAVSGDSFPMFVTWNTLSTSGDTSLRGCIGTFEPLALEDGIKQYSLTA